MNASSKDLARIAASVARESTSRASRMDGNETPSHSVRARVHGAMTVGLAIAVAVLAFKLTEERDLRRRVEAHIEKVSAARPPNSGAEQQQAGWWLGAALTARIRPAGSGAAQAAVLTTAVPRSAARDSDSRHQLRRQLSDPTLRNVLRGQQRSAALQMYGDLLRSWRLPADKSDRVLDLLAEQQLREMDRSQAASDTVTQLGSVPPDVQSDAVSDDLKALLSDAQRAQLSQQQATLSERMTVSALSDELSLAQMPMTDSQQQQLIQIMYDERTANLAPNVDNVANSSDAQRALEDWQSALDQRVQDRTASILNSDQQTRFEQFMARQREARNAFASFSVAQSSDNANAGGGAPPSAAASPPGP